MVWLPFDGHDDEPPWDAFEPDDCPPPTGDKGNSPSVADEPLCDRSNAEAELERMSRLVWHKELLLRAMGLAELQLKAGRRLSVSRRLNNFVRPLVDLQARYRNPPLLKYALEQTIEGPALRQPDTRGWIKYLAKVCENNSARFTGTGAAQGTNAAVEASHSPERLRDHLHALLREAYDLNKRHETEAARTLLWRMLGAVPVLAPSLYANDADLARATLVESFKRGSGADVTGEQKGPAAFLDYLPESAWPHRAVLSGELAGVSGVRAAATDAAAAPATQPPATAMSTGPTSALDRLPSQPMFDI
jgi:hypothetical protein